MTRFSYLALWTGANIVKNVSVETRAKKVATHVCEHLVVARMTSQVANRESHEIEVDGEKSRPGGTHEMASHERQSNHDLRDNEDGTDSALENHKEPG